MTDPDLAIIRKILAGDEKAVSALISKYKDKAMSLAFKMLKKKEDAEEALQDAFIQALKGLKYFEGRSSFSTWFYRIVYNVCCNVLQKNKKYNCLEPLPKNIDNFPDFSEREYEIANSYDQIELKEIIDKEIEKLDPLYSSILMLFYVQEFGYDEIVHITGLPLGTVKTRLSRGRTILRGLVMKRLDIKTRIELENFKKG